MLQQMQASADVQGQGHVEEREADEDEDDPDFIMPPARNAESVIGSDVDMGSASENENEPADDELLEFEALARVRPTRTKTEDVERDAVRDTIVDAEDDDDSEKENAPPPASQQSQGGTRSNVTSPSLGRSLLPSRAVMDDDEDELPAPRAPVRRGRRSALADDDADDEAEETSLQPGPFDRSRANENENANEPVPSQGRARVPLGDISSQSIDQSMPFSRSSTSSPAMQHALPPGTAVTVRRDPLLFPLAAGQDEDESFRTDDIPSQAADLGRFFEPTMPPPPTVKSTFATSQHQNKGFWDQTQTQSQSQSQDASQFQPATRPRELVRDESANSALGAFFEDTQPNELRGESLDIFDNPKVAGGKAHGFTQAPGFSQLFAEGTPASTNAGAGGNVWDASSMPPPKSTDVDAFAALRRAQMGEAMDLFDNTPSVLPSFDESQAEREAYAQAQAEGQMANRSPEKMYMNRDGFFTQTKPSQQPGLWSQYDTQSQSQSQTGAGGAGTRGVAWPSPAPRASARRGSDVSNVSHDSAALALMQANGSDDEDEEDDAPVQLKRLRRGNAASSNPVQEDNAQSDAESDFDDENGPPSSQPEPKTRNAFDVLRQGPILSDDDVPTSKGKKLKPRFLEAEAEESEDEELGGNKRGDGGGLKGVFGDDNGSVSGGDEDEDDEDDADAEDLQELVDNERDVDEAEKDEIALARFREDMEAKDREELEIHQRAIQGGFRNRRRGAGLNGIEGYLDDDADDAELRRLAAMHMSAFGSKKRKLLDGSEDKLEKLAEHAEASAFVQVYAGTHDVQHESANYNFLQVPLADDVDSEDGDEDGIEASDKEDEEDGDGDEGGKEAAGEELEEDAFGSVVKQPRKMGYNDVRAAIRERRKAKKRNALDDDDDEEDAEDNAERRNGNDWDSDNEDDTEARLAAALKDRIKVASSQVASSPLPHLNGSPNSECSTAAKLPASTTLLLPRTMPHLWTLMQTMLRTTTKMIKNNSLSWLVSWIPLATQQIALQHTAPAHPWQ